jgi:hypothetical protein
MKNMNIVLPHADFTVKKDTQDSHNIKGSHWTFVDDNAKVLADAGNG